MLLTVVCRGTRSETARRQRQHTLQVALQQLNNAFLQQHGRDMGVLDLPQCDLPAQLSGILHVAVTGDRSAAKSLTGPCSFDISRVGALTASFSPKAWLHKIS